MRVPTTRVGAWPKVRFPRPAAAVGAFLLVLSGATSVNARPRAADGDDVPLPAVAASAVIPEPLRGWTRWVLQDHEDELCPVVGKADDGTCVWAGRLELSLDEGGGTFSQQVEVLAPAAVELPGGGRSGRTWPFDVQVDGKAAVVVASEGPKVQLAIGRHTLTGRFQWRQLPESLPIAERTGLVSLRLLGRTVEFPSRSDAGALFLQRQQQPAAEEDRLDIAVHRRLSDEVPVLLTTRLVLNVSGKAREVVLGRALPAGFVPHALEAGLPARIEPDGRLRVQLRPGSWTLSLIGRHDAPLTKVARPVPDGPWKEGEEVWVFAARPELRVVTVEGVATIDPQQTTLPAEWKELPAYLMAPGATMTLSQRRRGDEDPAPDQLELQRQLWLDFDGGGFTARDVISGTFQRAWRLAMGSESRLGRVAINGQGQFIDQFITRVGANGPEGVEIRQSRATLRAESRIASGKGGDISAVGWDQNFQSVAATLALPPGWMLAHASGADTVSATWIQRWTLMDLFLLLITGIGIGKVLGWRIGALALVTLGLVLPERDAPKWIWLCALVAEVLVRALPAGRLRLAASAARLGTWVVLLIAALPFAVNQVRVALHPALGAHGSLSRYEPTDAQELREQAEAAPAEAPGAGAANAPAADQAKIQQEAITGLLKGTGELGISGIGSLRGGGAHARQLERLRGPQAPSAATQNLAAYDPNVMVQTGPGVPRWSWAEIALTWNGPVEKTQRLRLWLVPPAANLALGLGRVALMALLVVCLFGGRRGLASGLRLTGAPPSAAVTALVLAFATAFAAAPAHAADYPSPELLNSLRERLLKKADCHPDCAVVGRLALDASPARLRLRFEAGAAAATALPLPGAAQHWVPASVTVDGKPALLVRADDGVSWTKLDTGSHQVVMEGPLPARETVQLPFTLAPHGITVSATGWKVVGVTDDGTVEGSLQLSREAAPTGAGRAAPAGDDNTEGVAAASLPPFVQVVRTLELGLKWQVHTRVQRQTPPGAAAVLEVPLLPGESVLTSGVHVTKGRAQVNLGPGDSEVTWSSTLAEAPELVLQAPQSSSWAEVWLVNASPVWHVTFSGVPPIRPSGNTATRTPEWHLWPGERVTVAIGKPVGVAGQTLTIDQAALKISPGIRSTSAELNLSWRSSRGGEHALTLPEGAAVDTVTVNGRAQPARQEGRRLTLPISPGRAAVTVSWRQPLGASTLFRAPTVDLGLPSANVDVTIDLASERWILLVGGPRLGPAVLFWSFLVVLVLCAAGLARLRLAPLGVLQWILLGLGLSQMPPPAAALVAGALLALGWRRSRPPVRRVWLHNLAQIVFAAWTVAAIAVLFAAIEQGLLEQPDMRITGNGSYGGHLAWFTDRVAGELPRPWVVSVPLLAYRLVMLAWALWLALSVIRWARWIWGCFTHGELWRVSPRKPPAAAPSESAPSAPPPA